MFSQPLYLDLPQDWIGWAGWLAILVTLWIAGRAWWRAGQRPWRQAQRSILAGLLILAPLASLFLALRLPAGMALPPPGKPIDPGGPALVLLSAVPWILATGLLGAPSAFFLALFSGFTLALWDTHSIFTPLEFGLMALWLSHLVNQRYRTRFFRTMRQPLVAAALVVIVYPLLYLVDSVFATGGSLASRLDYSFSHAWFACLAVAGQLLVGAAFAQVIAITLPQYWSVRLPLVPSPSELKMEARFMYSMAPLALVLLVALMGGDWIVAGNSAQQMLRDRMATTSSMVAESVPFFLETGQQLIQQLANNDRLYKEEVGGLPQILSQDLRSVPFFRQLYLLDEQGNSIAGYPDGDYYNSYPPPEELRGIELALSGVPIQNYTIDPVKEQTTGQVSFIATVADEAGKTRRVIIGHSDLASNPFTRPVLDGIRSMAAEDGEGMLLDGNGRIMYHPNPARLMETYHGKTAEEAIFFDEVAPDGTRQLVYYQPVRGHPWSVVLSVPARRAQQLALNIAIPLLGMILLLFVIAFILLRVGLRTITSSLQTLGHETNRISSGQLDHSLPVQGEDEIGQLSRSFERMRVSLKSRLDELNRLLVVTQGVASSLEIQEAIQPVLDAALSLGASSARAVLVPSIQQEMGADQPIAPARFGLGPSSSQYSGLDEQILGLANRQEAPLVVVNPTRGRVLNIPPGAARPESLIALPLRHESLYYGVLWLAYDRPHQFTEDENRFLVTLAGQAALAAANSQLFQSAEIGRQRLAAILASTPDPVLVTDQQNRLLLTNPAAWQELGLGSEPVEGQPIDKVTTNQQIIQLLQATADEKQSAEITLLDNRVYLATASTVLSDGQRVGRVCVMRDITHFKQLEALKSEFVQTVSHDLRSPLTLMRGYSTMLEMVGELNDQQMSYVRKILGAIENMTHLVSNLLDLGRIEAGVDLQRQMVLVHDVVERVSGSLLLQANQKGITLTTDIPSQTVPLVEADLDLLQQALYNLIENAIKYTNPGGKVKVSVRSHPEGMLFEVCDNGIGIAPIDQPRLFDKFYRGAQRDGKKQSGTGLGLAIVKSIAERHGGKIWVESQLGKGSTFYMLIPLRQPRKKDS